MITLFLCIACAVGGWYAHKTKWHKDVATEVEKRLKELQED